MIICPHCGRENEDHYKFCLGCGSQLPRPEAVKPAPQQARMINCSNCGTPVPSNFKFCGACGSPVAAAQQPPAAAPPVSAASAPVMTQPASAPPASAPPVSTTGQNAALGMTSTAPTPFTPAPTPASAPVVDAKLVVIRPDGTEGATIPLTGGEVTIGRTSEHQALSSDPFLSPQHAKITARGDHFVIDDLDSLNGVFYRIRTEHELQSGDYIRLGQELLLFERMEDVEPMSSATNDPETLRGGSPDIGYWGRLSLISGPDVVTRAFTFSDDEINVGREIGDIVFRDDGFVSGRHARISKVDNRVLLKDLGSSNGTYLRVRDQRELHAGDLILMGQQLFRLVV